jgi:hypothetical protein
MEPWSASGSMLAPIVVGVVSPTSGSGNAADVWQYILGAAVSSVPSASQLTRRRLAGGEVGETSLVRRTFLAWPDDGAARYAAMARLADVHPGAPPPADRKLNVWEVGILSFAPGAAAPAVPDDRDVVVFEVTWFHVANDGTIQGAHQLALLRHLWVLGMQRQDPDLVIFGGQHHWDEAWWPAPQPAATQS